MDHLSLAQRLKVRKKIAEALNVEVDKVPADISDGALSKLGLDSLDQVELLMEIEDELGIDSDEDNFPPVSPA